ncbi:MAG: archease [Planctomycetes bacterium]|nr:archease [Planctomycetota bacterium]
MYEIFDHTADIGLRVRAEQLEQLFEEAGRGLMAALIDNPEDVQPIEGQTIRVEGRELDYLMVDWLSELLFLFEQEARVFAQFRVRIDEKGLTAAVRGERLDPDRHRVLQEIKAITYHNLKVEWQPGGWLAEIILDV